MNIHSIRVKIIFNMVISLLVAIVLVGSISIYQSKDMIESYSREKLDLLVRSYAYRIDSVSGASKQSDINEKIAEEKLYETGYLSLLDEKLNFVVHPSVTNKDNLADIDNGNLKFLVEDMKGKAHDIIEYTYEGERKIIAYYTLNNGYVVMGNVLENEIFKDLNHMINMGILTVIIVLLCSIGITLWLSNRITKPLMKLTGYLNKTAQFDLVNVDDKDISSLLKRKDEIGIMTKAIANMRGHLRETAQNIKEDGRILNEYTKSVSSVIEETFLGIESISEATHNLAQQAVQLATISQDGVENLHSLAENINRAVNDSNDINLYIDQITKSSQKGMDTIKKLDYSVTNTTQNTRKVLEKVTLLEAKSEQINQIVSTISNIAKQTNLLALNASIEAARAGEQGRGFAVVAEEIQKLAENVTANTKEIESSIKEILEDISEMKEEVNKTYDSAVETSLSKIDTENQFKDIENAIVHIVSKIKTLIVNIDFMDENKNSTITSIQKISVISEETSATTQEVYASIEQQALDMQEISRSTMDLNQIAMDLNKLISLYRVE